MRVRSLLVLVLVVAVLAPVWCDDWSPPTERPSLSVTLALRHGSPLGERGVDVSAAMAPADSVFLQGEPIDAAFTITNVGSKPYRYMFRNYDRSGRMDEYALEVTDTQGRLLPDPRRLSGRGEFVIEAVYFSLLGPGQSFTEHVYLNRWVLPLAPGSYRAVGAYKAVYVRPPDPAPMPEPFRSPAVPFVILPRTDAEMRTYLAGLGRCARFPDDQTQERAVKYLAFTGSSAALPYLIRTLYTGGMNARFYANEGFIYYAEHRDEAVAALVHALEVHGPTRGMTGVLIHYQAPPSLALGPTLAPTLRWLSARNPQRRAAAAEALWLYGRMGDAALVPLLGALQDSDAGVRLAAAEALWTYRDPRVLKALLAASHDPDEGVRLHVAAALIALGDDSQREFLATAIEKAQPGAASEIIGWLAEALSHRNFAGPKPENRDHQAWVKWLREKE